MDRSAVPGPVVLEPAVRPGRLVCIALAVACATVGDGRVFGEGAVLEAGGHQIVADEPDGPTDAALVLIKEGVSDRQVRPVGSDAASATIAGGLVLTEFGIIDRRDVFPEVDTATVDGLVVDKDAVLNAGRPLKSSEASS